MGVPDVDCPLTKSGAPTSFRERKRYYRKLATIKEWIRKTLHNKTDEGDQAQSVGAGETPE
jgi:hypothetical protein